MATVSVYGSEDAHLNETFPTTNFAVTDRQCGWAAGKLEIHALLLADLSAYVPVGSTITDAVLWLYVYGHNDHASDAYTGYRMIQDWVHDECTWNIYSTGNNWGLPGASLLDTDYDDDVSFGPWDPEGTPPYWTSVNCATFVQDAWANRSKIFHAYLFNNFAPGEDENADILFRQHGAESDPWYIAVTYTPPEVEGASRNRGYVLGSKLGGLHLPDLPRGWLRRRGLVLPVGA